MQTERREYTITERLAFSFNLYRMWLAMLETQERMETQESELRAYAFGRDDFTSDNETLKHVPVSHARTHAKEAKALATVRALITATYEAHYKTDSAIALWNHIHKALYELRDKTPYKHAELYEVLTDAIEMAVQLTWRVAAKSTVEEWEAVKSGE